MLEFSCSNASSSSGPVETDGPGDSCLTSCSCCNAEASNGALEGSSISSIFCDAVSVSGNEKPACFSGISSSTGTDESLFAPPPLPLAFETRVGLSAGVTGSVDVDVRLIPIESLEEVADEAESRRVVEDKLSLFESFKDVGADKESLFESFKGVAADDTAAASSSRCFRRSRSMAS